MPMRPAIAILILAGVSQAAEWKRLFDGKSLDGWSLVGPGRFVVEEGMLKTEAAWAYCGTPASPSPTQPSAWYSRRLRPMLISASTSASLRSPKTRGTPCTTATKCRLTRRRVALHLVDLLAEQSLEAQSETGG